MRRIMLSAVVGAAIAYACVPADNRPTPGALTVTVSPSPAIVSGVVTADGWNVTFDRVLIAIGRTSMSDQCARYSDADYDRLLDVTHKADQKLSILHGIGQCDFRFRVQSPTTDALLGDGVSEDDKTRLRTPGGDPYIPLGGVGIDLAATATRNGTTKRFHLMFRPRVRYGNCKLVPDAGPAVDLASGVDEVFDIRIEAEAVLRDDVDAATASLRFEPFAAADADGDGNVTLDELRKVPISHLRDGGAFEAGTYDFDEDAGVFVAGQPIPIETFGDYVYEVLLPTLPRFRDIGTCTVGVGRRGGGGGGVGPG